MAGTATPKSYRVLLERRCDRHEPVRRRPDQRRTAGVASGLDTQAQGEPVVVYNPLNIAREDVVEADLSLSRPRPPQAVRVFGPDGKEVAFANVKAVACSSSPRCLRRALRFTTCDRPPPPHPPLPN